MLHLKLVCNKYVLVVCLAALACPALKAQTWALKTNLLADATTSIQLGAEFPLADKWTLETGAAYNGWTFSNNKKWKHWLVQPEVRYWTCDKFMGHFFGFHLLGGQYNLGNFTSKAHFLGTDFRLLKQYRYEGWMAGAGLAYGYSWPISKHWSVEATLGLGYVFSRYSKFYCPTCGDKIESGKNHHYVGPTKAAVSLIAVF